jgi:hypothetical protein
LSHFDISNNSLYAAGCEAVAAALDGNQVITELNIASNSMGWIDGNHKGASGIVAIANAIKTMRALLVLNLASNNLGALVMPEGWSRGRGYHENGWYEWYTHISGTDQKERPIKPEGIIALANAIPDMRALTSLNLASNGFSVEVAKIIAAVLPGCT